MKFADLITCVLFAASASFTLAEPLQNNAENSDAKNGDIAERASGLGLAAIPNLATGPPLRLERRGKKGEKGSKKGKKSKKSSKKGKKGTKKGKKGTRKGKKAGKNTRKGKKAGKKARKGNKGKKAH